MQLVWVKIVFLFVKNADFYVVYLDVLICTIFEAKQQKRRQKRLLVCVDIKMMID